MKSSGCMRTIPYRISYSIIAAMLVFFAPTAALAESVTISYNLNGVAPVVYTSSGENDAVVEDVKTQFDGYTLTGWNDKADGTGKSYKVGDHVSHSTILYAQWSDGTSYGEYKQVSSSSDMSKSKNEIVQTGIGDKSSYLLAAVPASIALIAAINRRRFW